MESVVRGVVGFSFRFFFVCISMYFVVLADRFVKLHLTNDVMMALKGNITKVNAGTIVPRHHRAPASSQSS